MKHMRIVQAPDNVLTGNCELVTHFESKLKKLVKEMVATLKSAKDPEGVGLAAPQVGLAKRIFVMNTQPEEGKKPHFEAFINPTIIKKSGSKAKKILEGCLSIYNVWGYPKRSNTITLSYQDLTGKQITRIFEGFTAVIVQHEVDHLEGTLFTHRVIEKGKDLYKIDKDINGESELTPLDL